MPDWCASSYSSSVLGPRQPTGSTCLGLWNAALPLRLHLPNEFSHPWEQSSTRAADRWNWVQLGGRAARPARQQMVTSLTPCGALLWTHPITWMPGHVRLGEKVILGASWNLYKRGVHYSWRNKTRSETSRCRWTWSSCYSQAHVLENRTLKNPAICHDNSTIHHIVFIYPTV